MKKLQNKTKTATIALILMLTISAILVALPAATAQAVRTKTTYAYLGAVPNPVGVNQPVLLHVGITDYLTIATDGWEDLTVTVTDPLGETKTLGPFRTDSTGGTGKLYTPTMVGTYTLQTHFPAQDYNWVTPPNFDPSLVGVVSYKASDSDILELVVQEEAIEYYPSIPLPSEYWTRPIDAQLREWASVSGNWVTDPPNMFAPYNDYAPDSAHILWAKPLTMGGVVGGELGDHAFDCGDAYRGKWNSPVIINGVLYYNRFPSTFTGDLMPQQGIVAVDLHTGEELWFRNNTKLAFGQTMYWSSMNMHGAFAYLWEIVSAFDPVTFTSVDTWNAYDPFTGEWAYSMTNMPSGGVAFGPSLTLRGPNGEILIYTVDLANGWMTMWNSSNIPTLYGALEPSPGMGFVYYSWMPEGKTVDATGPVPVTPQTPLGIAGYQWNVTIPTDLPGGVAMILEDRILGSNTQGMGGSAPPNIVFWSISTKPGQEGTLLFNTTWQTPLGDLEIAPGAASLEDGVFTLWSKETRAHYGFSTDTGKYIWGPTESQAYQDIYYSTIHSIAYGKLFSAGAGGIVYCYNVTTGERLWTYEASDPYQEILWANNWWMRPLFITDGKIYLNHEEHSVIDPKPRGAPTICLDVDDGSVIWRIDGAFRGTHWGGRAIIGDSIIATMDTYDQRIYAIGKGPSETTVTAPDMGVPLGSSVVIRGTITDQSAGAKGTPAIADEHMSEWMLYVYKQFPKPADATGVPVTLEAIDPHGEYVYIDTATSDASGNYGFTWKPTIEGQYMIMATFYGSKAYYGSTTTTYLTVDPAEESNLAPLEGSVSNVEDSISNQTTYILAILALVIIAVVIAVYSVLKSRK